MCLAIPGKVLTIEEESQPRMGSVSFAGVRRPVCLDWVPEVKVGDYVLVHVGFALSRVDEEEAEKTLSLLRAMECAPDESPPSASEE
jgi:hydrogenase expression/formation protein HypC